MQSQTEVVSVRTWRRENSFYVISILYKLVSVSCNSDNAGRECSWQEVNFTAI